MLTDLNDSFKSYKGELEFIIRDKHGRLVENRKEPNIVKIFAKEILSHRLPHSKIWNPDANSGAGAWESNGLNLDEFSPKYIVFGASYNTTTFAPLDTADPSFYYQDTVLGGYYPVQLTSGAAFQGGLIKAVPVSEPLRPLKRVERIFYQPSYQPAGTPLLQDDVRAINNIVVFETVLRKDEYNGMGITASDSFTIAEVALVGAPEVGSIGSCDCDPHSLFLEGDVHGYPLSAVATGTSTISLDQASDIIKEGDQIRITDGTELAGQGGFAGTGADILDQVSPYYLVISKSGAGRDIVLDRTPAKSDGSPIVGTIGVLRDSFRIFSHRILKLPLKKTSDYEITVRWSIILN